MEAFALTVLEPVRGELTSYLCRLVLRPQVAEELVQTAFLRALEAAGTISQETQRARAWLFRVATNLAFDELRRHSNWREFAVSSLRETAEATPDFMARSRDMIGTPETKAIAREHLVACFACTMKNLPERRAAALLLKEVHGFSIDEAAGILQASAAQVKNWLQEARARMTAIYDETCALIGKGGVCHQCVELDGYMQSGQGSPLPAGARPFATRVEMVRAQADQQWGRWHHMLFALVDDIR
jgi:RNA polymerase sigma-70 factor (ECF subfamily)